MELTDGQKKGLELAQRLAREPLTTGVICGPAGTGKTSLIKSIIEVVQGQPVLLTPTGKAAARLTEVTGYAAGTIHRWLYKVEENAAGFISFTRKRLDEMFRPASGLIVVDEASMLGPEVWNDLWDVSAALNCSVLLVGDAFQLPPVQDKGAEPFTVLEPGFVRPELRVELTEILRQALDSPIIRATMAIREGDVVDAFMDLDTIMPDELDAELIKADMVICRSNKVRHGLNTRCRALHGFGGEPQVGEPLLVLKNNYALNIYNGEVHGFNGFIDNLGHQDVYDYETGHKVPVVFQTTPMTNGTAILAPKVLSGQLDQLSPSALEKSVRRWQRKGEAYYVHANYGYALTCHRAQGSEANYVIVGMESGFNYAGVEGRRWTYTALSRAKKRVAIFHIR